MKIGDIVILTEDSSFYKACMNLPRIKPLSDFKLFYDIFTEIQSL